MTNALTGVRLTQTETVARRPLVLVGNLPPAAREVLQVVARELGAPLIASDSVSSAPPGPLAFLVPLGTSWVDNACLQIRQRSSFAHVPVIGIADEPSDLAFNELFACGGDDLVTIDPDRLRARLRTLVRGRQSELPAGRRGLAIVASVDANWRTVMGRALWNGGYEVDLASDAAAAHRPEAKLVVMDEAMLSRRGRAILDARSESQSWVVAVGPGRLGALRRELAGVARLAVVDAGAPPENVLFLASELGFDVASRRASPRLLYGTTASFRVAGRARDEVGFTYNLSASGLYIRTLAPLEPEQDAWLELRPPRSERHVRLVGKVVWRRAFGQSETATVPPGFGVQLRAGLDDDLEQYRLGYESLNGDD